MQQQTSLHITTPCHENWNAMTPTEAGRFCASCSKQVVDFTLMSDTQILHYLSKHSGGLCGRFDAEQLARPLVEPVVSKKRSWWLAMMLPLSLLIQKSWGQTGKKTTGKMAVKVEQPPPTQGEIVMGTPIPPVVEVKQQRKKGKIVSGALPVAKAKQQPLTDGARVTGTPAMTTIDQLVTLQGTLWDDKGNVVANASVMVKGTPYGCVTDSAGRFLLKLRSEADSVVVEASSIGYGTVEKKVSLADAGTDLVLTLTTKYAMLDDVAVTGYTNQIQQIAVGGISICRRITKKEKRDSLVKKVVRLNTFTVYPNPARSGSEVQVRVKKAGNYELQLLNNSSALLKTEAIVVNSDGGIVPFQLPANVAAGVYYLRLINEDRKGSYLEKVVVN